MTDSLAKFMRRVAQLATEPGCYQIMLWVDSGKLRWSVARIGKVEGT